MNFELNIAFCISNVFSRVFFLFIILLSNQSIRIDIDKFWDSQICWRFLRSFPKVTKSIMICVERSGF